MSMISDDELLRRLSDLLQQSRRVEAELVAHIGEVDERRLYASQGSPSMLGGEGAVPGLTQPCFGAPAHQLNCLGSRVPDFKRAVRTIRALSNRSRSTG